MKQTHLVFAAALSLGALATTAHAALVLLDASPYNASAYYTTASGDSIAGYSWSGSGSLYYQTSTPSYSFGGFYRYDGLATTTLTAANSHYSGASVVTIGDYVYYNTSDQANTQFIYKHDTLTATTVPASATPNWGLYSHGGALYITGSAGSGNQIFHSTVGGDGGIQSSATPLGSTPGYSGPLTFDSEGNLYYAVGAGSFAIYKWTASEVAAAINDPGANALIAGGHAWSNFIPAGAAGATSMAFDQQGNLLVTFTNYSGPSELVSFGVDEFGDYVDGSAYTLLTDTERLGQLALHEGELYVASGDTIYNLSLVPEPATYSMIAALLALACAANRRRRTAVGA